MFNQKSSQNPFNATGSDMLTVCISWFRNILLLIFLFFIAVVASDVVAAACVVGEVVCIC